MLIHFHHTVVICNEKKTLCHFLSYNTENVILFLRRCLLKQQLKFIIFTKNVRNDIFWEYRKQNILFLLCKSDISCDPTFYFCEGYSMQYSFQCLSVWDCLPWSGYKESVSYVHHSQEESVLNPASNLTRLPVELTD